MIPADHLARDNTSTIKFDDIRTIGGYGTIPLTYHCLKFNKELQVIAPGAYTNRPSRFDLQAAVSHPNAVLSSKGFVSFEIDVLATTQAGLAPYFGLASLYYLAPHLHDSQPGCYAVTGYKYDQNEPPTQLKACHNGDQESPSLIQFEGAEWRKITKVVFESTSTDDEVRRCFVDNIRVRFYAVPKRDQERKSNSESKNSTIINFDDIPTTQGLADVFSPYHHLNFSSAYSIITPRDPALRGRISEHDLNSAVSPPNALIGSRYHAGNPNATAAASFSINLTTSEANKHYPYFDLLSFYIKPLDAPPPGVSVYVKGYGYDQRDPRVWHVDFIPGYHLPLLVKMREYSGEPWDKLWKVEIWADYGEDQLDWEFCVDDLELQFYEYFGSHARHPPLQQAVLQGELEGV
ncbi:MAG: hypothetical protein M1830_004935 [Pleopsidium flavum]|nr:MAG: hypothetical protein M1830_004935 [Pleopsidium flavum]